MLVESMNRESLTCSDSKVHGCMIKVLKVTEGAHSSSYIRNFRGANQSYATYLSILNSH